jgi:catechol 2,3-dioxygenase-like lactoylglutathione lyase family enzyme
MKQLNRLIGAALALTALAMNASGADAPAPAAAAKVAPTPHTIGSAKLNVSDLAATQAFYEKMFGMKEVAHFNDPKAYDEPILGFEGTGTRIALFAPTSKEQATLKRSEFPVVLIYTPDFEQVTKRIEDAKYQIRPLPQAQSGTFKIAIARDPSGNAVEILSRPGSPAAVGGSKLIVSDREKAEDWFTRVFGAKVMQRYQTATYDEVLLTFGGDNAWLALFQPKNEAPLTKARAPVVAIYTTDFDNVIKRVNEAGLGTREIKSTQLDARIVIAQDPAGNAVEIISRAAK